MPTINADISIDLDIQIEAESYAVADELIQQFITVVSNDKRINASFGSDIKINVMESDELDLEE